MRPVFLVIVFQLTFLAEPVGAQPNSPPKPAAQLMYQQGLYFQHTVGELDAALEAYNQALAVLTEAQGNPLVESILIRRAKCLKLLGKTQEHRTTLAALRKRHSSKQTVLDQTQYFPPETDLMLQVDLESIKASALFKRMESLVQANQEEIQKVTAILGFNPLEVVKKVSVAASFTNNQNMPLKYWLVLTEGDLKGFQPDVLLGQIGNIQGKQPKQAGQNAVEQILEKIVKKNVHGVEVWNTEVSLGEDKQAPMKIGLARLDDHSFVLGDLVSMRHFLAARAGKSPGLIANSKLSRLGPMLPKKTSFWLAVLPQELMVKFEEIQKNLGTANIPALDTVLLSGRIDQNLQATAVAWAADNESAKNLSDIARGLIALANMFSTEEPLVDKLLKSLTVQTKDRRVTVSVTLPGDLIANSAELEKTLLGGKPKPVSKPKPVKQPKPPEQPKPVSKPKQVTKS